MIPIPTADESGITVANQEHKDTSSSGVSLNSDTSKNNINEASCIKPMKSEEPGTSTITDSEINVAEIEVWEWVLAKGSNSYQTSPLFPKDCCGLPYGARQKQLFQIFSTLSNPADIKTPGTPQYKAFNWIIYDDDYCLCPNNSSCELIQRYVMAVFYYSTGGEKWVNCGAASTVCNPSGSTYNGFATSACFKGASERWLAPVSSCRWCGNVCDDLNHITCITQIDISENPRVQFKFSLMD
jgi:hypothetical protein